MKAGKVSVKVVFEIDTNGCLKVKVEDPQTGALIEHSVDSHRLNLQD